MRYIVCCFLLCQAAFGAQAHVSYSKGGGRFGDNLLIYLHAKWLSYRDGVPLLYVPFAYSTELMLDQKEVRFNALKHYALRRMVIRRGTKIEPSLPFLYECPYFPALEEEQIEGGWFSFSVDWKDLEFRQVALAMIAPKEKLDLIRPPEGAISVAIHVREGGGFDTDHTRLYDPLKLPPMPFYIEALSRVIGLFPSKKIYCRIFTDAVDTNGIAEELAKAIPLGADVILDYREEGNHHTKNVMVDFYSLFHFDVLIRPRSNFSIVPALLHDYAVVCSPVEYVRTGEKIEITRIEVEVNAGLSF